jgi:hypothetical protein
MRTAPNIAGPATPETGRQLRLLAAEHNYTATAMVADLPERMPAVLKTARFSAVGPQTASANPSDAPKTEKSRFRLYACKTNLNLSFSTIYRHKYSPVTG